MSVVIYVTISLVSLIFIALTLVSLRSENGLRK